MNRPITSNETESVIKTLLANKSPRLDDFTGEFHQALKEQVTTIYLKVFPPKKKMEEKKMLLNSFYKSRINTIPKSDTDTTNFLCF